MTSPWGAPVLYLERTVSTMEDALRLREQGYPSGTVVAAGFQERGRRRFPERVWDAEPGRNLLFTLQLDLPPGLPVQCLPVLAGLALSLTVEERFGLATRVKWPNDLLHDGRKLAGVLCEAHSRPPGPLFVLVGVGLNCNQRSFPWAGRACSLAGLLGREVELPALLEAVLGTLAAVLRDPAWQPKLESRLYGVGRAAFVRPVGEGEVLRGVVQGVAGDGALLLRVDGSPRAVYSGELSVQLEAEE